MAVVIATLPVADFDIWYAEFERMHAHRERCGDLGRRLVCREADAPDRVVVVFEWDTVDNARDYFESPALRASIARADGRATPRVRYLEGPLFGSGGSHDT